jgi:hypothetical protein
MTKKRRTILRMSWSCQCLRLPPMEAPREEPGLNGLGRLRNYP